MHRSSQRAIPDENLRISSNPLIFRSATRFQLQVLAPVRQTSVPNRKTSMNSGRRHFSCCRQLGCCREHSSYNYYRLFRHTRGSAAERPSGRGKASAWATTCAPARAGTVALERCPSRALIDRAQPHNQFPAATCSRTPDHSSDRDRCHRHHHGKPNQIGQRSAVRACTAAVAVVIGGTTAEKPSAPAVVEAVAIACSVALARSLVRPMSRALSRSSYNARTRERAALAGHAHLRRFKYLSPHRRHASPTRGNLHYP